MVWTPRCWERVKRGHCPSCQRHTKRRIFWPVRFGHVPPWVMGLPAFHLCPIMANFCQITPSLISSRGSPLLPNSVLLASSPLSLGPQSSLLPFILRPCVIPEYHLPLLHVGFSLPHALNPQTSCFLPFPSQPPCHRQSPPPPASFPCHCPQ